MIPSVEKKAYMYLRIKTIIVHHLRRSEKREQLYSLLRRQYDEGRYLFCGAAAMQAAVLFLRRQCDETHFARKKNVKDHPILE